MDPLAEKYVGVSSYVYCHDNPVMLIDPTGMGDEEPKNVKTKLTGSNNLLVFINDKGQSANIRGNGNFDYIALDNIDDVQSVLENYYGKDNVPMYDKLVVRSHGRPDENQNLQGPILKAINSEENIQANAIYHDPSKSSGLNYLKSKLTNNATILFTACNIIMGYNDNGLGFQASAKSLVENYSTFFLNGTDRSIFFNTSTSQTGGKVGVFNFNHFLSGEGYGGFMQFYYNNRVLFKNNFYYDVSINSNGTISRKRVGTLTNSSLLNQPVIKFR